MGLTKMQRVARSKFRNENGHFFEPDNCLKFGYLEFSSEDSGSNYELDSADDYRSDSDVDNGNANALNTLVWKHNADSHLRIYNGSSERTKKAQEADHEGKVGVCHK